MTSDHWFIDALGELVEEAKRDGSPNVLTGLRSAVEIFIAEANLNEKQVQLARDLIAVNTL